MHSDSRVPFDNLKLQGIEPKFKGRIPSDRGCRRESNPPAQDGKAG